jgi:predicted Ser/Thr protein kinase
MLKILKKFPKLKLIGKGVNGKVYSISNTKVLKVAKGTSRDEYNALKKLSSVNHVPKVKSGSFFTNKIKNVSGFIMNKLPSNAISLKKFHELYGTKGDPHEKKLLENAVKKIHNRGISHGNLHTGNIIVSHKGSKITKIWIIDFGRSILLPNGKSEKSVYAKLPRVHGYSPSYGKLYGRNNAPSRPNFSMI